MSPDIQKPLQGQPETPISLRAKNPETSSFTPDNKYKIQLGKYTAYSSEAGGPLLDKKIDLPGAIVTYYKLEGENGTSLDIAIREIGLDTPLLPGEPIPFRIDHGCLCMTEPLEGHDCKEQRDMALNAMKQVGRGIMIEVDTPDNEGMGYGRVMVAINSALNQQRISNGEDPLTIHEFFEKEGITEFDVRKHPEVAALFSYKLDQLHEKGIMTDENPLVLLGSSPKKLDSITNGHKIPIPFFARVLTGNHDPSKENHGYDMPRGIGQKGVYLQYTDTQGDERYTDFIDIYPSFSEALQRHVKEKKKEAEKASPLRRTTSS